MADALAKGARITGATRSALGASLAQRYQAGESIRALADDTGRSFGFVHGLIVEAGVPLRPRGGATRGAAAAVRLSEPAEVSTDEKPETTKPDRKRNSKKKPKKPDAKKPDAKKAAAEKAAVKKPAVMKGDVKKGAVKKGDVKKAKPGATKGRR